MSLKTGDPIFLKPRSTRDYVGTILLELDRVGEVSRRKYNYSCRRRKYKHAAALIDAVRTSGLSAGKAVS